MDHVTTHRDPHGLAGTLLITGLFAGSSTVLISSLTGPVIDPVSVSLAHRTYVSVDDAASARRRRGRISYNVGGGYYGIFSRSV